MRRALYSKMGRSVIWENWRRRGNVMANFTLRSDCGSAGFQLQVLVVGRLIMISRV